MNQQSDVAYISHILGFAIGVPFGIAWSEKWKKNLLISIGLLLVYVVLLYFVTHYLLPALL